MNFREAIFCQTNPFLECVLFILNLGCGFRCIGCTVSNVKTMRFRNGGDSEEQNPWRDTRRALLGSPPHRSPPIPAPLASGVMAQGIARVAQRFYAPLGDRVIFGDYVQLNLRFVNRFVPKKRKTTSSTLNPRIEQSQFDFAKYSLSSPTFYSILSNRSKAFQPIEVLR